MIYEGIEQLQVTRSLLEMGNRKGLREHRTKNCLKGNMQIVRMQLGLLLLGWRRNKYP